MLSLLALLALGGCSSAGRQPEAAGKEDSTQNQNGQETELDDDIALPGLKEAEGTTLDLSQYPDGVRISKAGSYTLSGTTSSPVVIEADKEDVILNLQAVTIRTDGLPALFVRSAGSVSLKVSGQNVMETNGTAQYEALNAALYSKDDLSIQGDGNLKITAGYGHAIKAKDSLDVDETSLTLDGAEDGIHINETGSFHGGSLSITSMDEGIQSEGDLLFDGSSVSITAGGDGIKAENELKVEQGTLTINSGSEGMESKNTLAIAGGTISIQAVDDGLNAASSLSISGGDVSAISSSNDGIDSNGDLLLSGGTVTASGIHSPELAFDTDNPPFEITGGTIIGLGSMGLSPTKMDQNVIEINVNSLQSVKLVQNGQTLLDWSAPEGMKGQSGVLTLSVSGLQEGDAVLTINGEDQTLTISEGLTQVGQIATMGGQGGMNGGPGQRPDGGEPFQEEMPGDSESSGRPGGPGNRRPGGRGQEDTNSSATESSGSGESL